MALHRVEHGSTDGIATVTLACRAAELSASFAPAAGMVGCSLRHRKDELLELPGGLAKYAQEGGTLGIPLLHPWANRLSEFSFRVAGREVNIDRSSPLVHLDPNGLPIHGLMAGWPRWEVVSEQADDAAGELIARFDFAGHEALMAAFPFPHELELRVRLSGSTLTHTTTLRASGDAAVPVSFGYHPYFRLPGQPADEWRLEAPVRRHISVDERLIPTGGREPGGIKPGRLGSRTFDDGFDGLEHPARFVLSGGGRTLAVKLLEGYPVATVWRPPEAQFICFEPMTAPTNALVRGSDFGLVEPGESYRASFSVSVSDPGRD